MHSVGDMSWRTAAIYCNWLHNKSVERSAFLNGAYDVSTFGDSFPAGLSDQRTRHPDARYWIPSWDEWLKAAHYDASMLNPDGSEGGWWRYANMSNVVLTYGPPRAGQANSANGNPSILLGSYPPQLSPWGLLDTAGCTAEWSEEIGYQGFVPTFRYFDGSAWPDSLGTARTGDRISYPGGNYPSIATLDYGVRIATTVPPPGTCSLGVGLILWGTVRRRRSQESIATERVRSSSPFLESSMPRSFETLILTPTAHTPS
mgnify:CR=1 FL=1